MSRPKPKKAPKPDAGALSKFHVICKHKTTGAVTLTTVALGKTADGVRKAVQHHIDGRPSLASSIYIASVVEMK